MDEVKKISATSVVHKLLRSPLMLKSGGPPIKNTTNVIKPAIAPIIKKTPIAFPMNLRRKSKIFPMKSKNL